VWLCLNFVVFCIHSELWPFVIAPVCTGEFYLSLIDLRVLISQPVQRQALGRVRGVLFPLGEMGFPPLHISETGLRPRRAPMQRVTETESSDVERPRMNPIVPLHLVPSEEWWSYTSSSTLLHGVVLNVGVLTLRSMSVAVEIMAVNPGNISLMWRLNCCYWQWCDSIYI
jgi:hypothetical protein